jgi:hypothetical protein
VLIAVVVIAAVLGAVVLACVVDWWMRPALERKARRASIKAAWRRATGVDGYDLSDKDISIDFDSKRHEVAVVRIDERSKPPPPPKLGPALAEFSATDDRQLSAVANTSSLHEARQAYDASPVSHGHEFEARRRALRAEWLAATPPACPLQPSSTPGISPPSGSPASLDAINAMAARHLRAIHAATAGGGPGSMSVIEMPPPGADDAARADQTERGQGPAIITRL